MSSDQPSHDDLPDAVAVPLVEPLPTGARIVEGSHVRPVPQETREEIIRGFGKKRCLFTQGIFDKKRS